MPLVIKAENLSKKYRIKHQKQVPYQTLREEIISKIKNPFDRLRGKRKIKEDFWALDDISFGVEQGEILGLIGPNGAGKTTILKILTRITSPTKGKVTIEGRISSLLEVGTGFHPELTGRENIYLNGAILGMRKKEINKKFDQIVDFAGIEKFLDTPVKRYSSGMYIRLAFSVAAHLEPDILLIDEVLSVGDAAFQKKSLGKMEEVTKEKGRTIVFVSHNMEAVHRLCQRTILLNKGKIVKTGPTGEIISDYLRANLGFSPAERIWEDLKTAPGDDVIRLRSVRIKNSEGKVSETIDIRKPVFVEIEYWNLEPGPQRTAGVHFVNEEGIYLFVSYDLHNQNWRNRVLDKGLVRAVCRVPGNLFAEGRVFVTAAINTRVGGLPLGHAAAQNVVSFNVFDPGEGDSVRGDAATVWTGVVRPMLDWKNSFEPKKIIWQK